MVRKKKNARQESPELEFDRLLVRMSQIVVPVINDFYISAYVQYSPASRTARVRVPIGIDSTAPLWCLRAAALHCTSYCTSHCTNHCTSYCPAALLPSATGLPQCAMYHRALLSTLAPQAMPGACTAVCLLAGRNCHTDEPLPHWLTHDLCC